MLNKILVDSKIVGLSYKFCDGIGTIHGVSKENFRALFNGCIVLSARLTSDLRVQHMTLYTLMRYGYMCNCSVVLFNTPLEEFFPKFFDNYLCRGIEEGNPHYLVGYSGKEMAEMVLGRHSDVNNYFDMGSSWMWIGRSIATSHSFKTILEMQPLPVWYYMFRAYHTADESHLLEWADSVFMRY